MVPNRAPALLRAMRIISELPEEAENMAFVFNPTSLDGQFHPSKPSLDGRKSVCVTGMLGDYNSDTRPPAEKAPPGDKSFGATCMVSSLSTPEELDGYNVPGTGQKDTSTLQDRSASLALGTVVPSHNLPPLEAKTSHSLANYFSTTYCPLFRWYMSS